jgi:hypothetical protein
MLLSPSMENSPPDMYIQLKEAITLGIVDPEESYDRSHVDNGTDIQPLD